VSLISGENITMRVIRVLAGITGALIVALLLAAWVYRDIPRAELEAKYANDASRFIEIDGARIHYRDEGDGPAILLIHAQFASLIGWDSWVEQLKSTHRVVRYDLTSHGLTGPDPKDDYSMERTMALTEQFIDAVGLEKFSIAGTSVGGTVAMRYSATHPERIEKLILLSPGALEGRSRMKNMGDRLKYAAILKYILPRAIPEAMLRAGFGDAEKITPQLVDRWYDLWMLEGQRGAELKRLGQYVAGDIESVVRSIKAPTLLLWGEENHQAHFDQAPVFMNLLENAASVKLVSYPGVGHMAVQEAGLDIVPDVIAFLESGSD
jgi:pimeloyl-ACP methyl ester carboxylesterase